MDKSEQDQFQQPRDVTIHRDQLSGMLSFMLKWWAAVSPYVYIQQNG